MMSSGCDRTSEMTAWRAWSCCKKDTHTSTHTQKFGNRVWSWRLFLCSQPDQLKQPDGRQRSNLTYYYQTQWLQWSPHSKTEAAPGFASDAQQFKTKHGWLVIVAVQLVLNIRRNLLHSVTNILTSCWTHKGRCILMMELQKQIYMVYFNIELWYRNILTRIFWKCVNVHIKLDKNNGYASMPCSRSVLLFSWLHNMTSDKVIYEESEAKIRFERELDQQAGLKTAKSQPASFLPSVHYPVLLEMTFIRNERIKKINNAPLFNKCQQVSRLCQTEKGLFFLFF